MPCVTTCPGSLGVNRNVRHSFAFKPLGGETGAVVLVAAPEGLAVGHGLCALVKRVPAAAPRDSADCNPGKAMLRV